MLGFKFFTPGSKSLFKLLYTVLSLPLLLLLALFMTTSETLSPSGGLLEQITTSRLLEDKFNASTTTSTTVSSDVEDESDGEVFEDGDINNESENESDRESDEFEGSNDQMPHESVAAVLTELSQATSGKTNVMNPMNNMNSTTAVNISNTTNTANTVFPLPSRPLPNAQMAATVNSINALLQSHLQGHLPSAPQKARLYGPIRANVNIRHGVWAPRLRCRKRKNLHAKGGIWISPQCTLEHLITLVRGVLPDEFEWDAQASPLRYQAVNDQSLQSLKTVSGTVASGQSLFSAFDLVRNRRSDGDNFILQLYVYGTWTVLLKSHHLISSGGGAGDEEILNLPPPPKKKYQQAHYSQQQLQMTEDSSTTTGNNSQNSSMFHMRLTPPNNTNPVTSTPNQFYTHPLAANAPVTFLPTVMLEMKLNGIFVPIEVTRRSFISAIRSCSAPKQSQPASEGSGVVTSSAGTNDTSVTPPPQNNNTNNNNNNNNLNSPPSDK